MRYFLLLITLALPVHAQTWTGVPAPSQAPGFAFQPVGSNYTWSYPFDRPSPAGTYRFRNAIVGKDGHRIGAWSQPLTVTLKSGWQVYGDCGNQLPWADDVGMAWKVECVDITESGDFRNGTEHYLATSYEVNSVTPYSASGPEPLPLYLMWQRFFTTRTLAAGGAHTVADPPQMVFSQFPNEACQIAYCRVTETGETALSPAITYTPTAIPGMTPAETVQIQLSLAEPFPQGSLGYHMYVKFTGGSWQRIPAPHCLGTPSTVDDWLWQWWDMQPRLLRTVPNAPVHQAAVTPQSRLCDLQIKLKEETGDITVPAGVVYETYCPVIDEWRVDNATAMTFYRQIKSANQGKWGIKAQTSQSGHTYWPALCIYNIESIWRGVTVNSTGSAAVCFADWSGGQSFGVRFVECSFHSIHPVYTTAGVMVNRRCSGGGEGSNGGGHTASELSFEFCKFSAMIPIWLAGQQTANCRFQRAYAHCSYYDRRASSVYLACGNQVRFVDGLFAECPQGGSVFRGAIYPMLLKGDDLWVDQSFNCLIEAAHVPITIKLVGGKLNCWKGLNDQVTLIRLIDQPASMSKVAFTDIAVQSDYSPFTVDAINPHYNLLELRFEDSYLANAVTLREPTKAQNQSRASALYPVQAFPTIPTRPVPGLQVSATSTVNSLTDQRKVTRVNWMK